MEYLDNSLAASAKQAPLPNIVTAVDAAHTAASNVEQVLGQLEDKLTPILAPEQNQTQASGGAPAPVPDKLHGYIAALEKRLYNLEARASSIIARLHL